MYRQRLRESQRALQLLVGLARTSRPERGRNASSLEKRGQLFELRAKIGAISSIGPLKPAEESITALLNTLKQALDPRRLLTSSEQSVAVELWNALKRLHDHANIVQPPKFSPHWALSFKTLNKLDTRREDAIIAALEPTDSNTFALFDEYQHLARASYRPSDESFMEFCQETSGMRLKVLSSRLKVGPRRPVYFVALDHDRKRICLVVR